MAHVSCFEIGSNVKFLSGVLELNCEQFGD